VAAGAAVVVLAGAVGYVVWRNVIAGLDLRLPVIPACVVQAAPDEPVKLDPDQMANAATVAAVGIRRGVPQRAIVVALATALQESKLRNLSGGDRDSIGLFQQRPSQGWGRPEQLADPRYASGAFYTALEKVPRWQQLRVTDAAQAVQRSAHPEAYDQWVGRAEVLSRALAGEAGGAVSCTVAGEPALRGAPAAQRLADSMRLDWGEIRAATTPAGLSLGVRDTRAGWQFAHWLVSHAGERGVQRVRFAGQEWNARTGGWTDASPAPSADVSVLAEVYPATGESPGS
jgi:hypothetical protein